MGAQHRQFPASRFTRACDNSWSLGSGAPRQGRRPTPASRGSRLGAQGCWGHGALPLQALQGGAVHSQRLPGSCLAPGLVGVRPLGQLSVSLLQSLGLSLELPGLRKPSTLYPWRRAPGLGRVRRAWVIPPISVSENHKRLPYPLVQVRGPGAGEGRGEAPAEQGLGLL